MNTRADKRSALGPSLPPAALPEVDAGTYRRRRKALHASLHRLQRLLRARDAFPVIVVLAGVDGGGKQEIINRLAHWMDPRHLAILAYAEDEAAVGPAMKRYWHDLPPRGMIGLVRSGWYSPPLLARVAGEEGNATFARRLARIRRFERLLVDDGALLLKFWLHLDAESQRERLQNLAADPDSAWRASATQWRNLARYEDFLQHGQRLITATHSRGAPWQVLDGRCDHARSLAVAETLSAMLARRLVRPHRPKARSAAPPAREKPWRGHTAKPQSGEDYRQRLHAARETFARHIQRRATAHRATIILFEGWDAAGKGGIIRRLVHSVDARQRRVVPISAPDAIEARYHYLWRFWQQIPPPGQLLVLDRSWYGRVLVERAEGLCPTADWRRAYSEIRRFEAELHAGGIDLIKVWLEIDAREQLARLQARAVNPRKQYKLSEADWRNHALRDSYEPAIREMLARTHRPGAPWVFIPANHKPRARLATIETLNAWLAERDDEDWPKPPALRVRNALPPQA